MSYYRLGGSEDIVILQVGGGGGGSEDIVILQVGGAVRTLSYYRLGGSEDIVRGS